MQQHSFPWTLKALETRATACPGYCALRSRQRDILAGALRWSHPARKAGRLLHPSHPRWKGPAEDAFIHLLVFIT